VPCLVIVLTGPSLAARGKIAACLLHERDVPRRPPAKVRADMQARQAATRGAAGKASQLPGLSPRGRTVLASLEHTRLWPGQAEQALRYWRVYQRDPYARRWGRPDSCGEWHCCPDIDEVRVILKIVVHNLPPRDARRFRSVLATAGDQP
jgi:hypothetical protein